MITLGASSKMPFGSKNVPNWARDKCCTCPSMPSHPNTGLSVPHLHHAVLQLRGLLQAAASTAPIQIQAAVHDRGLAASGQWHDAYLQGEAAAVRLQLTSSVMPVKLEGQQK